jgi:bacteriochlorophyll C8 methyltransferase
LTLELCKKISESGLKINFGIETHLNNLTPDLGKELHNCGLRYIEVGIESVTAEVIEASKRFSIEKEKEIKIINDLEEIGIKIKTMFIYGLPLDNLETCKNSLQFAKRINSFYSQFNVFTPYPGTPIFEEYKNIITKKRYEDFTQSELVFKHKMLSELDIEYMINKSYKKYFLRFKYFKKIFTNFLKSTLYQ